MAEIVWFGKINVCGENTRTLNNYSRVLRSIIKMLSVITKENCERHLFDKNSKMVSDQLQQ